MVMCSVVVPEQSLLHQAVQNSPTIRIWVRCLASLVSMQQRMHEYMVAYMVVATWLTSLTAQHSQNLTRHIQPYQPTLQLQYVLQVVTSSVMYSVAVKVVSTHKLITILCQVMSVVTLSLQQILRQVLMLKLAKQQQYHLIFGVTSTVVDRLVISMPVAQIAPLAIPISLLMVVTQVTISMAPERVCLMSMGKLKLQQTLQVIPM